MIRLRAGELKTRAHRRGKEEFCPGRAVRDRRSRVRAALFAFSRSRGRVERVRRGAARYNVIEIVHRNYRPPRSNNAARPSLGRVPLRNRTRIRRAPRGGRGRYGKDAPDDGRWRSIAMQMSPIIMFIEGTRLHLVAPDIPLVFTRCLGDGSGRRNVGKCATFSRPLYRAEVIVNRCERPL